MPDNSMAIFVSLEAATKFQAKMEYKPDVFDTCVTREYSRGQLKGYRLTYADRLNRRWVVTNDMVDTMTGVPA